LSQDSYNDSVKKLIAFLNNLESDLGNIIEKSEVLLADYPELQSLLKGAFKLQEPRFFEMRTYLQNEKLFEILMTHGLVGTELNLKLGIINMARGKAKEAETAFVNSTGVEKSNNKSKWRRWLGRLLEGSDIIMDSLAEAGIPGAGALGEFKSVTEKLVAWFKGR
jgi:hypothetical protein